MKKTLASSALALAVSTGCSSLSGVQGVIGDAVLPPAQAAQLGDRMASQVESEKPLDPSSASQQRIAGIGRRLLPHANTARAPYDFTFKVIEEPGTVNAFALPGGHIYATSGLLQLADTDGQLASVVAHEIAHVTQRHIAERMATQYGLQVLGSVALGGDAGTLSQLAGSVVQQGFLMKYSREQELEADRVGLGIMKRAGYNPEAAVEMFRKLAAGEGKGGPAFFSSHPTTGRRIEQLQGLIARQP